MMVEMMMVGMVVVALGHGVDDVVIEQPEQEGFISK